VTKQEPLSCLRCPSLCCKMAGYVEVSAYDIRRLASHLKLTTAEFEDTHIVEVTRRGKKRIKSGYKTCQFLADNRRCTVYSARPTDCRGYVCWDQEDNTLYEFARFLQKPLGKLRKTEDREDA
jgi:Fe-S-cluster containining protein